MTLTAAHLADSLGRPGGAGDDVLCGAPAPPPVLAARPVHRLLCGRGCVDGRHQALQDTVVVVDHLM